jgi:hypothetical protein
MIAERRRQLQTTPGLEASLTDAQRRIYFENLKPHGWSLFAQRAEAGGRYMLVQTPKASTLRHLCEDGTLDLFKSFNARKAPETIPEADRPLVDRSQGATRTEAITLSVLLVVFFLLVVALFIWL